MLFSMSLPEKQNLWILSNVYFSMQHSKLLRMRAMSETLHHHLKECRQDATLVLPQEIILTIFVMILTSSRFWLSKKPSTPIGSRTCLSATRRLRRRIEPIQRLSRRLLVYKARPRGVRKCSRWGPFQRVPIHYGIDMFKRDVRRSIRYRVSICNY